MAGKVILSKRNEDPFRKIQGVRVLVPVVLGLGVVGWMMCKEYNPNAFSEVVFSRWSLFFICLAIVCMLIRDFGYMVRIRVLSDGDMSWRQAFRIIMLWEFTSAATPSAVGGTSIAILYVNKEGFSLGRSSAIVLATSFLDELYFIIMLPLLLLTVDLHKLFAVGNDVSSIASNSFFFMAIIGITVKTIFAAFVGYGLFVNPRGLKWLLLQIFRLPFIRRWRHYVNDAGTEIIYSSKAFKEKPFWFWFKAFLATFFSWTARYWVVNALLVAFFTIRGFAEHFLIFARQLIMWIMQLVSPTPGGSGFSEYIFSKYLSDFIPASPEYVASIIMGLALLWRLISYYPYLIVGAVILPRWIRNHFGSSR